MNNGRRLFFFGAITAAALLSGLVFAKLWESSQIRKLKLTSAKLYWTANCLEHYFRQHASYPQPGHQGAFSAVSNELQIEYPEFLWALDGMDGWGRPIQYSCSFDGLLYWIISPGADGVVEIKCDFSFPWPGKIRLTRDRDEDIACFTGFPAQWPDGYSVFEPPGILNRHNLIRDLYAIDSALSIEMAPSRLKKKGELLTRLGLFLQAKQIFRILLELDTKNADLLCQIAEIEFHLGDHSNAVLSADTALQQSPDIAKAWYFKGLSLYGLKNKEEARKALGQAVALDVTFHQRAWKDLGRVEPYQLELWKFMNTIPAEGKEIRASCTLVGPEQRAEDRRGRGMLLDYERNENAR
jgi:tetratricopeptide (TPR) repeat protein